MTEILITNAYSALNRGDAAIILGMVRSLRSTETFRDAVVRVSSANHPDDCGRYPVPVVPSFHSLKNRFSANSDINALYFLVVLLPLSLVWAGVWRLTGLDMSFSGPFRELMRSYAGADLVIAAGGGYLYTTSQVHGNVVLVITVYSFCFGRLLGKPVFLYSQSIGPFATSWQQWFVRRALTKVRLVEVREEISGAMLDGWRLPIPVRRAADAAFLIPARKPEKAPHLFADEHRLMVGMTVRNWFRDPVRQEEYEITMASFVTWLVEEMDAKVVFFPQVTFAEGSDDDREAAQRVATRVTNRNLVYVLEDELDAEEIKWLCGRMEIFVGTRMHSNIFAMSCGIPTIAIAYQPKTSGIMRSLGLEEFVLPIEKTTPASLRELFEALASKRATIRELLLRRIPEVEEQALLGGELIAKDFSASVSSARDGASEPGTRVGR
jgi:colanic acid/amylovoran biosynthesis protein